MKVNNELSAQAQVFDDAHLSHSLFGLSSVANADNVITLTRRGMTISRDGNTLCEAAKHPDAKLWTMPIQAVPDDTTYTPFAQLAIHNDSVAEKCKFLSATFGNPADSTLLGALRGILKHDLVTASSFASNLPATIETAKGHLDRNRKNQRSTKRRAKKNKRAQKEESVPETTEDGSNENVIFARTLPYNDSLEPTPKATDNAQHSDATGRFPVRGKNGSNYVLVSVFKNYIHIVPFPDRTAESYVQAYRETIKFFSAFGECVGVIRLDNETSDTLETFFREEVKKKFEYCPPDNHRTNRAERSIRTTKNHMIATLAGCHKDFPLYLWDVPEFLAQCELTLNLMRPWGDDPAINAHEGIFKMAFDFDAHPLAPLGTLVLALDSPAIRGTWAVHGTSGYNVGPALEHYRSHNIYNPSTKRIRVADSLAWFPDKVLMPGSSMGDRLEAAIKDLSEALADLGESPDIGIADKHPYRRHTETAIEAIKSLRDLYFKGSTATPLPRQAVERVPVALPPLPPPMEPHAPKHKRVRGKRTTTKQRRSRRLAAQVQVDDVITPAPVERVPGVLGPQLRRSPRLALAANAPPLEDTLPFVFLTTPAPVTYDGPPLDTLNLGPNGKPLKYNTALKDPLRKAKFMLASSVEWRKHLTQRKTMRPIHKHDQPHDRRADTT